MDNFIRIHEALQVVCAAVVPPMRKTLVKWHTQQQSSLGQCTGTSTSGAACKATGKAQLKSNCATCVQWRQLVEQSYYPQSNVNSIPWANINPTILGQHYIEVAKGYTLKLQQGIVYNDLGDFDVASLLKVLLHFEPLHHGDAAFPGIVEKVNQIRNYLSHLKLKNTMVIDDTKTSTYFDEILDLVTALHPHYLTQDQVHVLVRDIKQIHACPVSVRMKDNALRTVDLRISEIQRQIDKLESKEWSERRIKWCVLLGALITVSAVLLTFPGSSLGFLDTCGQQGWTFLPM